jgi:tetratricopeptide (TPR) repeat protein
MKKCFVIMPIGSEKDYEKYRDIYQGMIKEAVKDADLELQCTRADEISKPGAIIKGIITELYEAEVVIADLSGLNANVFYELGVRHALKGGTIMITDDIKSLPFDLKPYRVLEYSTDLRGAHIFKRRLREFLKAVLDDPQVADNPVLDFLPRPELERVEQVEAIYNRQLIDELRSELAEKTRLLKDEIESLWIDRLEKAVTPVGVSEKPRGLADKIVDRIRWWITPEKDRWFEDGNAAYSLGNYQKAIGALSKAIELDPQYVWAYIGRGAAYRDLGEMEKAMVDFNRAIELDPNHVDAYLYRGVMYGTLGKMEIALADFNRAIELDPKYAWAYVRRGLVYEKLGKMEIALADFNRAIELVSNYVDAYVYRGLVYEKLGKMEIALADFNKAIELDPKYTWAYVRRGLVYRKLGEMGKALADFNRAIELDPKYASARNSLAYVLYNLDLVEEAVKHWEKAVELKPSADYLAGLGLGLWKMGEKERAVREYRRALELDKRYIDPEWIKSEHFWSEKAVADARPLIEEAKKEKP